MVKEKNRVAFISVLAAVFLTGFKLVVGLATGSLGILSEALHSALALVAAVVTFFLCGYLKNRLIKTIIMVMGKSKIFQRLLKPSSF